jgi:hypothetical protein
VCPCFVMVAQAEEGSLETPHRHQTPGVREVGSFHEERAEATLAGWEARLRSSLPAGEGGVKGWLLERVIGARNAT